MKRKIICAALAAAMLLSLAACGTLPPEQSGLPEPVSDVTPPPSSTRSPTPTPTPEPQPSGKIEGLPVVQSGSRGDAAKILQGALIAKGYPCGSSGIDGVFGVNSVAALNHYQKAKGLTADGIAGPATWGKLLGV